MISRDVVSIAPEAIETFDDALNDALQAISKGRTLFSQDRHAKVVAGIHGQFAKSDPGLERYTDD